MPKVTKENLCFALLCLIFAGFFFIPKSPHRVLFYIFLALSLWAYKDALKDALSLKVITTFAKKNIWPIMLFFYCVFTSLLFALGSPEQTIDVTKKAVFILAFIVILIAILKSEKDWNRVFLCFAASAAIIGTGLCIYYFGFSDTRRLWGIGRGVNPNTGGLLYGLAAIIIYFLHTKWDFGKYHRLIIIFGFAICILTVLITQSRGSMLALAGTFFIILALQKRFKPLAWMMLVITIFLGVLVYMGIDIWHLIEKADNNRFAIWNEVVKMITQNPVFGIGYGHDVLHKTDAGNWRSTHNIYLGIFVYHGIIGLALFLMTWAKTFKTLYQKHALVWGAIMLYASIFSLFEFHTLFTNLNPEWLVIWMPIAYGMSVSLISTPPPPPHPSD